MKSNKEIKEKLNIDKKHFVTIEGIEGVSFTLKEWNELWYKIQKENQQLKKQLNQLFELNQKQRKEIERLNKENKLLNTEKLELIRLRKFVEEANNPNSWCINCGHAIDEHGGETLDDLNHCNSCQEVGTDCNDFKPCEYICQIIHKRELQLKTQLQEQRNKIKESIDEKVKELEVYSKRLSEDKNYTKQVEYQVLAGKIDFAIKILLELKSLLGEK